MKFSPASLAALVAAPLVLAATGCVVAPPPPPPAPHHPAYLHALTDLRDARWNLEHRPGDAAVSTQEDVAIVETDRAINDAKTAAMEDGKNVVPAPAGRRAHRPPRPPAPRQRAAAQGAQGRRRGRVQPADASTCATA